MDSQFVIYIGRRALETALLLSAPVLAVALVVGFLTAMLQAVTSVRDMTLGMVVKLAAIGLTLILFGGWMMQVAVGFTTEVFNHLQTMGH